MFACYCSRYFVDIQSTNTMLRLWKCLTFQYVMWCLIMLSFDLQERRSTTFFHHIYLSTYTLQSIKTTTTSVLLSLFSWFCKSYSNICTKLIIMDSTFVWLYNIYLFIQWFKCLIQFTQMPYLFHWHLQTLPRV